MIFGLIVILIMIIILLIILLLAYRRQINDICRQLQLLLEQESNLIVHTTEGFNSVGKLVELLNKFLLKGREERNNYQKKENAISSVYTNISHDIRTPLTSLDGYIKLLSESESEEDKERYITVIQERISSLKEMLEEMFTFAKLKNQSWQLKLTKCSFTSVINDTLVSYYDEWDSIGVVPDIQIPPKPVYFLGNSAALKRVLQNILKNALEHGGGQLKVVMENTDNIKLEIGNILPEKVNIDTTQVFEKFYKEDEARSKTSTGLGLSIAKEFVERMGGKIYARQEKEWFYIVIELPVL